MSTSAMLESPTKADYAKARRAALELLDKSGVKHPPVDPVRIAEDIGVKVLFVQFGGESDEAVSGFFDCEENIIMVNKREFPLRQTFTVAHELGHKVLHEEWAKSDEYSVLLRDPTIRENSAIEQEANFFAANLLMPKAMMDLYYERPVHQLSSLFAVSVPAVKARLQSLYGI